MKSTLYITALVAASALAANAAITSDAEAQAMLNGAVYSNSSLSTSESAATSSENVTGWTAGSNDSFTLTATLDVTELAKRIGSSPSWSGNGRGAFLYVTTTNYSLGVDYFVYYGENGIGATHGRTDFTEGFNGNYANLTTTSTGAEMHMLQVVDFSNVTAAALTLSHRDTQGTAVALTLISEEAGVTSVTTYEGTRDGIRWSGGVGDPTTITYDDAIVTSLHLMSGGLNVGEGMEYLNKMAVQTVPEPTTSTLSLLALAGLVARRRRH